MIFISGVHGVGKSYFCNIVKEKLGIKNYSASSLIAERKKSGFNKDKLIPDIDENQQHLLAAIKHLRSFSEEFILDGHFCLLNAEGAITRIPIETFTSLKPEAILLLTEKPEVICARRMARDNIVLKFEDIAAFQNAEISYAQEVAALLGAKIYISSGSDDLEAAIKFLSSL